MWKRHASNILIMARANALQLYFIEVARARVVRKAVAAGADVAFIEALESMRPAKMASEIFKKTNTLDIDGP
jgi:2-methylisocitrate lyase-like PEP mutase family enzyme